MAKIIRKRPWRWFLAAAVRLTVPRHRIGVAVVGVNPLGELLLLRHVFHPHAPWGLPGGWLESGEDPADCALRELGEETGLTARLGSVIYLNHQKLPSHIGIAYLAYVDPAPMRYSAEIIEGAWFSPKSLPQPLLPFVSAAVAAALEKLG